MAKTKKKISKIKTKKKVWYKILSPKTFGMKEVGESYLSTPEKAVGRVMKINLRELTGSTRDQNVSIGFSIDKVDASTLHTSVIGYTLAPAYVKRMVRKNTSRLDDYFILKTKDGKELILKTLTIALHRAQRSTKSALRVKLHELLKEEVSTLTFDGLVQSLINSRLQQGLKKKLSKVFPVKEVAVRVLKLRSQVPASKVAETPVSKKEVDVKEPAAEKSTEKVAEKPIEPAQTESTEPAPTAST